MAHRILNNLSWLEDIVKQSTDGYVLDLGEITISDLISGDSFIIALSGGGKIVIRKPFELLRGGKALNVDPSSQTSMEEITQTLRSGIHGATVMPDGTLRLALGVSGLGEPTISAPSGNWQVHFSNGSSIVGLRGGGIEILPPD